MTPLKQARINRGLSLEEVAAAVGVDKSSISRIERGHQEPTADLAAKLAKYFRRSGLTEMHILYPDRFTDRKTA